MAFLGSGDDFEVRDQPSQACALSGEGLHGLVVDRKDAFGDGLDGGFEGGDRGAELVREVRGELATGGLGSLQPVGELVDRRSEGGQFGSHQGVFQAGVEPAVRKRPGGGRGVLDRGGEPTGDQPADSQRRRCCHQDPDRESGQHGLFERSGDVFEDLGVHDHAGVVQVVLEQRPGEQERGDQDRAGTGEDDQPDVDQQAAGQSEPGSLRRGIPPGHPGPIR